MNISTNTLLELKCCECGCYLSRIPIYVGEDGTAICGRCPIPKPEDSKTNTSGDRIPAYYRMIPYEYLIKEIPFPCMYENRGCALKMFVKDLQHHEENCNYAPSACPFRSIGTCQWIGRKQELLEHCKTEHVDRLLEHPCVFKHNYTKESSEAYITIIFNTLFLVKAKICTNKIYYGVNCFGDVTNNFTTKFKLVIQRKSDNITKSGIIIPFNPKENVFVCCDIPSLIGILNGSDYENTNFTIHIEYKRKVKCIYCNSNGTENESKFCEMCDSMKTKCSYCEFKDIEIKTKMHRLNFCKNSLWCWVCNVRLSYHPLQVKHYDNNHKDVTFQENIYWNISKDNFKTVNGKGMMDFIIDSKYDRFFGTFVNLGKYLDLHVCCTSIQSEEACQFTCKVSIENGCNDNIINLELHYDFNSEYDWIFKLPAKHLFLNNRSSQIKIQFLKTE